MGKASAHFVHQDDDVIAFLDVRPLFPGHVLVTPRAHHETLAESGTQAAFPFPGYLIYWRVGNALFAVLDAGGPTAGASLETTQSFANAMDARAQKI